MVKTHTTTSLQYILTLLLEEDIAVGQLCTRTSRQNGKKYQSPWLEEEGLSSIVKRHTTTSLQYIHTLSREGGIALAQLHSSTNGSNGEKKPKSMAQERRVE